MHMHTIFHSPSSGASNLSWGELFIAPGAVVDQNGPGQIGLMRQIEGF